MNEKYFEQLLVEVSLRNLTASTGRTYQGYLKSFLEQSNINADEITMENVRTFLIEKKASVISAAMLIFINRVLTFLHNLLLSVPLIQFPCNEAFIMTLPVNEIP